MHIFRSLDDIGAMEDDSEDEFPVIFTIVEEASQRKKTKLVDSKGFSYTLKVKIELFWANHIYTRCQILCIIW